MIFRNRTAAKLCALNSKIPAIITKIGDAIISVGKNVVLSPLMPVPTKPMAAHPMLEINDIVHIIKRAIPVMTHAPLIKDWICLHLT